MKTLTFILALLLIGNVYSQNILLQEDFESTPPGFFTFSLDNFIPDCGPNGLENGWILSNQPGWGSAGPDKAACGCSWHQSPGGAADDWMVTSPIAVSSNNVIVEFSLFSENKPYPLDVYASKTFDGTAAGLSDFTHIETIYNIDWWAWIEHTVDVSSMNLVNGDNVYIAFRNNATQFGRIYFDDLIVSEVFQKDADLRFYDGDYYSNLSDISAKGSVYNTGLDNITSFTVNTQINNGTVASFEFTGINLNVGDKYMFTVEPLSYDEGENDLVMYVSNVNGTGEDANANNDTLVEKIYVIPNPTTTKNIILEDYTGAWCGNCVDAIAITDVMSVENEDIIVVANHSGDGMEIDDGESISIELGVIGRPSMSFDRNYFDDYEGVIVNNLGWPCTNWINKADEQLQVVSPLDISIVHNFNNANNELTVTVIADFIDEGAKGDLRLNCYLLEDSVSEGVGYYWDQKNYRSNVVGHPFYGLPENIVGFQHMNVLRECMGGAWGIPGTIPMNIEKGESFEATYIKTIPANWDIDQVSIVGLVQRYNEHKHYREIMNAKKVPLDMFVGIANIETDDLFKAYPNPANDRITIECESSGSQKQLEIRNQLGQLIYSSEFYEKTTIDMSGFAEGLYFVRVLDNSTQQTIKFTKQ